MPKELSVTFKQCPRKGMTCVHEETMKDINGKKKPIALKHDEGKYRTPAHHLWTVSHFAHLHNSFERRFSFSSPDAPAFLRARVFFSLARYSFIPSSEGFSFLRPMLLLSFERRFFFSSPDAFWFPRPIKNQASFFSPLGKSSWQYNRTVLIRKTFRTVFLVQQPAN